MTSPAGPSGLPGRMTDLRLGDCREILPTLAMESVQCCITSPPYWGLRDYGTAGQIGLEPTPAEYVEKLVTVFREVRRVLRDDGTLWLNLGDSYAANRAYQVPDSKHVDVGNSKSSTVPPGLKPKDLVGIPWRVAFALQADGWWLRSDIVWAKPNPMPESVTDRPTKAHEYVFLLAKSESYYYDADGIAELSVDPVGSEARYKSAFGGAKIDARIKQGLRTTPKGMREFSATRNARTVWTINSEPFSGAHFAVMPTALVERCVRAGTKEGDVVLDPFGGSGTVALVAQRLGRSAVSIELSPEYVAMQEKRVRGDAPLFAGTA